jgi:aspartate/methionine/tyrosine aminotransferase
MTTYNPLAEALNNDFKVGAPQILDMLSARGKAIYFPSKGILGQTAEAKGTKINATIGTAFEDDGSPLALECMEALVNVPSDAFLYAPSFGLPKLREEWAQLLAIKNPGLKGKSFSQPVVAAALTHALSVSGYMFVDAGDEMILPDLYWDNYEHFQRGLWSQAHFFQYLCQRQLRYRRLLQVAQCRQTGEEDSAAQLPQ